MLQLNVPDDALSATAFPLLFDEAKTEMSDTSRTEKMMAF